MILLEGADRCGKTTLGKKLLEYLPGWSFRGHTKPPVDPFQYFSWFIADTHQGMVVDRFHLSEIAYRKTYRPDCKGLSDNQFRVLDLAMASKCTMILYMDDDIESIVSRWSDDEMFDPSGLSLLMQNFTEVLDKTILPFQCGNLPSALNSLDNGTLSNLVKVKQYNLDGVLPPASIGIGNPTESGGTVIVGPPRRMYMEEKSYSGFLPFSQTDQADRFWECFDRSGLNHKDCYFTHSDAINSETLLDICSNIGTPKRVITMDAEGSSIAAKALFDGNTSFQIISIDSPEDLPQAVRSNNEYF